MTQISVVAAIIRRESSVLLGRRPHHKHHGGLWEFPGGKREEGETEVDAVTRELMEEFGVETLWVGKVVYECRDPGLLFLVRFFDVGIRGNLEPTEHTEVRWFEPATLPGECLAPCDARFVAEHLLRSPG